MAVARSAQALFKRSLEASGMMTSALHSGRERGLEEPLVPGQETVAMIVHELRGPLATMSGILDAHRADPNAVTDLPIREVLARQLRKALRLVNDLLDASCLTRGAPYMASAPVDLSQVINDAAQDLDREIRKRQQSLTREETPEHVWVRGGERCAARGNGCQSTGVYWWPSRPMHDVHRCGAGYIVADRTSCLSFR